MIKFLKHILQECNYIKSLVNGGLSKEKFLEDETLQRAESRSIEIIGEATKSLDDDFRREHGDIDWKEMDGMRDRLIHNYLGVNYNIVWDVMINKIPPLSYKIKKIIAEEDHEST